MASGDNNGKVNLDVFEEFAEGEHGEGETGQHAKKPAKQQPVVNLADEGDEKSEENPDDEHEEDNGDEEDDDDEDEEGEEDTENSRDKSAENGASKKRTSSGAAKDDNENNEESDDDQGPDSKKPRRAYEAADTTTQEAQESVDSSYGAEDGGSNGSEHGNRTQHWSRTCRAQGSQKFSVYFLNRSCWRTSSHLSIKLLHARNENQNEESNFS